MKVLTIAAGMLIVGSMPAPASAQSADPCPARAAVADSAGRTPDIVLSASARIRELRFESQPRASIRLLGCEVLDTVLVERRNLPEPVQPGVTYRDVFVGVRAEGYLRVECLLPALLQGRAGAPADTAAAGSLSDICAAAADSLGQPRRRQ